VLGWRPLTGAFSQVLRKNLPEAIGEHFGYAMVNRVARVGMWQKQDLTLRVFLRRFNMFASKKKQVDILEERLRDIKLMIKAGDLSHAREMIETITDESPSSSSPLTYIRARMYEEGLFGKIDIDSAVKCFSVLIGGYENLAGEAMVGVARMLYKEDPIANSDRAIEYCLKAIELEPNPVAMMLLAAIYEDTKKDFKSAKMWSLRAFRGRSPWGLRYMAALFFRREKYVIGGLYRVAALFAKPFMLRRYDARGPFK
jgi:tetratricopeptide (TPR) repeat protein